MTIQKSDIERACKLAKEELQQATSSQLRKFMTDVTRLRVKSEMIDKEDDWETKIKPEFLMLEPRLEYQVNRPQGGALKPLLEECKTRMKNVKDRLTFIDFALFIEAVVAYHKEKIKQNDGNNPASTLQSKSHCGNGSPQRSKQQNLQRDNNYRGGNKW